MKINIGTGNSLKVEPVRAVFATAFPEDGIEVTGTNVPSGVADQPFAGGRAIGDVER